MNIDAAMDRVKLVMGIPLSEQVAVVNDYIETNNLTSRKFTVEEIESHIGMGVMLSHVYSRITRPHSIGKIS